MLTLTQMIECESVEDFNLIADEYGFKYFWQRQSSSDVFTYDRTHSNFFDEYYDEEVDLICPAAWAFRSRRWPIFTLTQARESSLFNGLDPNNLSTIVWSKAGILDAVVVLSGRSGCESFAVFGFSEKIDNAEALTVPLFSITRKLDEWLLDSDNLRVTPRSFKNLSEKEVHTLKSQVCNPHLSLKEQAEDLGISEKTLQERHKRIARKFGVKRFAGAVIIADRSGFLS